MKIALFVADGRGFFLGLAIMALVFLLGLMPRLRRVSIVCLILGAALVVLSSTALPAWSWVPLAMVTIVWLGGQRLVRARPAARIGLPVVGLLACAVAAAPEIPRLFLPHIAGPLPGRVYIIGDSLSAGTGVGEQTWPQVLEAHGVDVVDLSRAGATVKPAIDQAVQIPPGPAVVILEIGGNDLLGGTSRADYAAGLERLLERVQTDGRRLLMFELPLPPFKHSYGYAQRDLAKRFDAQLIPKRVLSTVLGSSGGTLDGLHLSDSGHQVMAAAVIPVLAPD